MNERTFSDELCLQASRLGPCGLSPKAPGTVGSAAAALTAPLFFLPLSFEWRVLILGLIFIFGSLIVTRAEKMLGKKDPGEIVIDELLGMWLTMLPFASLGWEWIIAAFALFRFFDIFKPYPIRDAEHWLPDGWGVMVDDAIAGLYSMMTLWGVRLVLL